MEHGLEVDSVLKMYGEHTVLSDIYIRLQRGEVVGLFGRNGSGKSTLLKIIFGTLRGNRCFIRIDGKVCTRQAFRSGQVAYLPQHNFLPQHLKVSQVIEFYIPRERQRDFLVDTHLFRIRHSNVHELSGGELRFLEIKLILFSEAPYILLDEPFNGLSPIAAQAIRQHIAHAAQTKGILLTDHNFREVHKAVTRILLLDQCYLRPINQPEELIPYGYYKKEE